MAANITRKVEVTVSMSGFDMGRAFAAMRDDEQAHFFQGIAAETRGWARPAEFQWQMMRDALDQMPEGLATFKSLAEYGVDK